VQAPIETAAARQERQRLRMEQLAEAAHWMKEYGGLKRDALIAKRAEVEAVVLKESTPVLEAKLASGQYEVVGQGGEYKSSEDTNPFDVYWVRFTPPSNDALRVVLPDTAENSNAYELRALSVWLQQKIDGR
jgi:hypothetical protein